MDQSKYAEYSIKTKKKGWMPLVYIAIVLLFMVGFYLMMVSSYGVILPIALVILIMIFKSYRNVEYEYIFITDELRIDRIFGGEKRKKALKIEMSDVESVLPTNVNTLPEKKKAPGVVFHDFSSRYPDTFTYTVTYYQDGKTHLMIFEPDDHILQVMKRVIPSKVTIAEVRRPN